MFGEHVLREMRDVLAGTGRPTPKMLDPETVIPAIQTSSNIDPAALDGSTNLNRLSPPEAEHKPLQSLKYGHVATVKEPAEAQA